VERPPAHFRRAAVTKQGSNARQRWREMMEYIELSDDEIAAIREGLRTSNDKNLIPLGQNLTDLDIEKLVYLVRTADD
jgi:hypothetical protein